MRCAVCGSEIHDNEPFCLNCGTRLIPGEDYASLSDSRYQTLGAEPQDQHTPEIPQVVATRVQAPSPEVAPKVKAPEPQAGKHEAVGLFVSVFLVVSLVGLGIFAAPYIRDYLSRGTSAAESSAAGTSTAESSAEATTAATASATTFDASAAEGYWYLGERADLGVCYLRVRGTSWSLGLLNGYQTSAVVATADGQHTLELDATKPLVYSVCAGTISSDGQLSFDADSLLSGVATGTAAQIETAFADITNPAVLATSDEGLEIGNLTALSSLLDFEAAQHYQHLGEANQKLVEDAQFIFRLGGRDYLATNIGELYTTQAEPIV